MYSPGEDDEEPGMWEDGDAQEYERIQMERDE